MPTKKPKTQAEWAEHYGWTLALLKSDSSLWKLFNDAIKGNWDQKLFVSKLKDTSWYKKYGETGRKALALKQADPGTWRERVRAIYQEIMQMAGTMGVRANWQTYWDMAEDAFTFGWTNAQIKRSLAEYITTTKSGAFAGQAGEYEEQLRQYAYSMGVNLDNGTIKNWVKGISAGIRTAQDYKGEIQKMAISAFPGLAAQIKGGMTVRDLADPYMSSMARILEINPQALKMDDPSIRRALQGIGSDSGGNATAGNSTMPLWQFENELRKDPRWLSTNNARQSLNSTARGILRDFGLAN
ncbi:hypothetical protein [Herbidospora cretacea]|uniref:hypothetical protein n=1 Tax=Herbidospora cretacea TaxID=28444 RepID=UPI000774D78B|nr:hypothetical protein [Herbidospora cretacea]